MKIKKLTSQNLLSRGVSNEKKITEPTNVIQKIPLELTPELFAPYGRVMKSNRGLLKQQGDYWKAWYPVDFLEPTSVVGIGITECHGIPDNIMSMERHVSREVLMIATKDDIVMGFDLSLYLGDVNAQPNADTSQFFLIRAGQAIVIHKGVWHASGFTLTGSTSHYYHIWELKHDPEFIHQDKRSLVNFQNDATIVLQAQ